MADGLLAQLFWRGLDMVDYWITQLRLHIADAICGPPAFDRNRSGARAGLQSARSSEPDDRLSL
jgi:hypothetical protein